MVCVSQTLYEQTKYVEVLKPICVLLVATVYTEFPDKINAKNTVMPKYLTARRRLLPRSN